MNDEFYIGYRKSAPAKLARYVFAASAIIVVAVVTSALAIARAQSPAGDGTYAYGLVETLEGTLRSEPFLHLVVGGKAGDDQALTQAALVVGQGKHGAPEFIRDAADKRVRFHASRIERHGTLMLESGDPSGFEIVGDAPSGQNATDVPGPMVILTGELVDTKCYLGVMNPGRGKVHRGCAAECLRGGVPPGLLVRDADGDSHVIVLEPADSTAPEIIPDWAARTIVVEGVLHDASSLRVLKYSRVGIFKAPSAR